MSIFGDIMGYIDSGRAASSVSNADIAAEHGVLDATKNGQQAVGNATSFANDIVNHAATLATDAVNDSTAAANGQLQQVRDQINTGLQPYTAAGTQGAQDLMFYAHSPDSKFNFNFDDYFNSDAYKFQLEQGTNAINNSMSASGLSSSGAALKELTKFGQGLGATYYNDAFNRAKSTFDTNNQAKMDQLKTLISSGEFATHEGDTANTVLGGQQAQNTNAAGYYAGNTQIRAADLLSKLGLQGAEFGADLGLKGAKTAGDYAVDAGLAHAGGIMAQGNALTAGVGDAASLLMSLGIGA